MMIDENVIEYIANLSRLELIEYEKKMFVVQLSDILSYIEKLKRLNTDNVKPMANSIYVSNVFRLDKPEPSISNEDALANAPDRLEAFFKVPKVIE
ncbi:MAG: Asp-tRNA(Asn)/Glu-tRNA(Gln) amidotransferase subunit GatC [Candidatus Loosdrechtia sp.]|uniref:Asp-tRNA(Asn)/Glu-tRNA(Gln) amidotransferase subunit GatC n=1 Tax=Candidatus Loosdrechtia sp. TaxID=3101272 RepID=UPI003A648287|nr:MAG: Asp-tRNA(Asn)/Glu-tRNA(Gln) amidotransferase subunit GatC [Candidatus Jettenia sp. AMX2]